MRIVLSIPHLDKGGPDRVFYELVLGLYELGVEPVVVVNKDGGMYWDKLPSCISKYSLLNQKENIRYPYKQLAVTIGELKPDIIIATLGSILTVSFAKWFTSLKIPLVFRPANHLTRNAKELFMKSPIKYSIAWFLNVLTMHTADFVVCQSNDIYSDLHRYGISKSKMKVIGNPINLLLEDEVRRSPNNEQKLMLLAIGRLTHQKGFDILINAMSLVKQKHQNIYLRIYGEGPDHEKLQHLISDNHLEHHVNLCGYTNEVEKHILDCDFVVSSSRYEGFPNVLLESLALGTPVIATNCPGGTRDMVKDGLTGWLCNPNSASDLASTIIKAYEEKRLSANKIQNFVKDNFSTSKIVCEYIEVFNKVIIKQKS